MPSSTVFVGNVNYDITEEQLIDIFRQAGPVLSFKLVMDRDTGRSKGYGFCEYADVETAASAVRNLNNYDFNGRRIRVDFSESTATPNASSSSSAAASMGSGAKVDPHGKDTSSLRASLAQSHTHHPVTMAVRPMVPQAMGTGAPATDAIATLLASMTSAQLFDVMSQMKLLVQSSPDQAKNLLTQNPQLCYALFQAMVIMKVIPPDVVSTVLRQALQQQGIQAPVLPTTTAAPMAYPAAAAMLPPGMPSISPSAYPNHPAQGMPAMGGPLDALPPAQRAALVQILHMPESQIQALPMDQRQQIYALRAQFSGQPNQ